MRFGSLLFVLLASCAQEYELNEKPDENDGKEDETEEEVVPDTAEVETETESETDIETANNEETPVAICDVNPASVTPPFESATWYGSDSYDPNGQAISYQWELISYPEGTAATLSSNQPDVSGFTPDQAGDYIGQLTVRNEDGLTDTCEATLQAIPVQNLWIEMFWEYSGDDMDLHLIAPNMNWQNYKTTDQDCYYGNCVWSGLDWGTFGQSYDDPRLDLDDIPGTGPENINVDEPESTGPYTVVVHDYPGSVYMGANNVTVNIYLGGSLVWTDTRTISGEDDYIPFTMVDWAAGVVIPL
jgi:hypothetical protein